MPVVRISQETYKEMEKLREGFETPAALIDRAIKALREKKKENIRGSILPADDQEAVLKAVQRSPAMRETAASGDALPLPQSEYRVPLLECLHELGGKANTAEIRPAMERKLAGRLGPVDYALQPCGAEVKWWNIATWEKLKLVKEGFLLPKEVSGRGIWQLSEQGKRYVHEHIMRQL